ncbi:Dicarboxylate carrier protein MatC N-terminus [Mycolicibacterium fortuitum]|uniref:Dicarboxylate carrier protein MatC N-terminus n=1 Tax=Mycolicibacterium fortuitum TaxID=1766 RepID=A0A378U7T4_MYCFO|nr:Dicarboxylate carrier protein MatC N-terminus [Mycolicibacterium fortuitum]
MTYFFGIAHANGTIDRIIEVTLARVGHRTVLLPLVFFLLTAAISAMAPRWAGW